MAIHSIPVSKAGKEYRIQVDDQLVVNDDLYKYALYLGYKAIFNRQSKIAKDNYDDEAKFHEAAKEDAEATLKTLYAKKGEKVEGAKTIKIIGVAKTKAGPRSPLMIEAMRIARELVRSTIKASGEKLASFSAKDITEAAHAYIEADPSVLKMAEANLASREEKEKETSEKTEAAKAFVAKMSKTGKGGKAKAKTEKEPISAKQAAIPAKHKPAQQHTAH